ncbi:LPD38 domain-containing protein [Pseudomonas citronellolis]|uniref:LPD38 domain-containing protein n=1 Tax=Pseudomonas citronellolis TaxID=53408 RepID=UPI00248F27CD|nr:LPD38 domain-containing protein [Pseudomonas citronellolis]
MANFFDQYDAQEPAAQQPASAGNFFDQYDGHGAGPEEPSISGEFSKGVGAGVDSLQGTLYGLAGLAGDAAGAEGLRDWGLEGYQRNQQEAAENAPAVGRFEDVHGAHDAALYAAQGLGQLVPFAASSVATGGIGGAVAKVAGRKAVERFAENQVAKGVARATAEKAAQAYGNKLAQRGAMAGVAANSVGTEQGSIYGDIYDKTGQYAPGTAAAYGAAAGALDALPEVGLISRLAGRGTGGIARQALKQAGAEGATEGAQTAVENLAVQRVDPNHQAFDQQGVSDIANASLIGALGGGVAGGGAAAAGRLRKPSEQMGLDPNAGPLSAAATVAVDGRVAHEVQRAALLNNAPAPAESGLREQDLADLPTAVAQQMFRTEADPDNPGALRYFRQDPGLQREVEVPEQDALAAAQQRIAVAQQQGLDPLDNRGLEELLPQVDEETGPPAERGTGMAADDLTPYERNQLRALGVTDEQLATMTTEQARGVPLPQVDFESGPGQVESVAEQPPLPTVEMDTGPMEAEQVAAAPVSGDPDFEFRVQKNGRPFKSERDVRLLRTLEEAGQAGEQPVVVPHEGGFAVAVRRPPAPTLALPAPDTLVVDRQGNAQRGPVAPFVTPERQRTLPGGPGMDQQARPGQRPTIEALLPSLRQRAAAGEQLDAAAIAQQTGASRAIAARAVQGVQAEQQTMAKPYTNRLQAGRALGRLPAPAAFEVVQRGSRDFRIQPKAQQEVEDAGNRAGPGDEREAGAAAAVPARPTDVAPVPAAEPGAGQPAGGRASARADRPAAEPAAERSPAVAPKEPPAPESSEQPSQAEERGDLPAILAMPRRRYIANQAKQEGLKKGSPGYGQAIQRLEDRYEADLDAASAGLSFERYNALNSDSPASVNRQAWEALRAEYGRYSQASYRASAPVLKGLRASQLQRALQERISRWRNAPEVRVVQSVDDLPPRLRQRVQRDGAEGVEGIFDGGAVYLVADNIGSYQHGGFVLAHEVLGHAGLQGLFGRRLEPLLHSIYRGNDQVRAAADRLAEQTGYRRPVAVEEVLADLAAAGRLQQQGFWPRLVSAIRAGLRAIGLDMKWTDGDLARLLANARGFIEGGAGRAAGEARYSRRGWDASFPDVAVAHPLAFLNNHPDYAAAKAGDTAAALRVARDAITPEFVEQVRQAIPAGSSPKIVPVVAREGAGNNRIPVIAAEVLAQRLGLQTDLNPVQQEKIGRTSASALERVTRQPTFQGEVAPGDYILLDDTLTQGGTLAQLKTHIEDNGGRVVLATALTGKNYSRKLSLDSSTLAEVRGKYGSIEPWFRETFGYGFEGLTQSEARTILTFDRGGLSPEQLRDRLAASRDARGSGVGQGATGDRSGTQAPVTLSSDADAQARYRSAEKTATAAFKRWFSDSKVVNPDGSPMVVYHGTTKDFTAFSDSRGRNRTPLQKFLFKLGLNQTEGDFFFAQDPEFAGSYAGEHGRLEAGVVMPVYLRIANPEVYVRGESQGSVLDAMKRAKRAGKDGLIIRNWHEPYATKFDGSEGDPTNVFVAFDSRQIKSAIGNNGDFDPSDPDIRYSRAGQSTITLLDQVANRGPVKFADHVTDAQRDALSKIGAFARKETIAETAAKYRDRWKEKFIQGVFDQFAPIAKLDQTAYMQARLSKGTDGALESTFLYGKPKLLDGALAVDPDGKGLRGILAGLKGEHDLFFAWMAGHRAERLAAEGRENLFTPENIRELKRLNQGTMEGGGSRTLAYAQAQKEFAAYQRAVLDVAEKAGLIDPEARKLWENEFYVPFYRVMEEGDGTAGPGQIGGLTGQRAFQKLKGGKEPLGDLMANTLANWSHLLTASMKNLAATNALKAAEPMGVATPVREAEKGAVRVMMGGREQHYLVHDPLVLDALTMLHQQDWNNPAMKAMRTFKHWLTTGVTSSPAFRARNLLRDSISAVATNDLGYNPLKNVAEGWRGTAHGSPVMQQLIAGGGAVRFGALNDGDQAAHAKRLIKDLGAKEGQILTTQEKITRALRSAWDRYQELGDRLESVNRATLYKKLREEGRSHLEASYLARDMMDFTSAGKWASVRFLTQIVPFMNARLQGMYKLGRGAGTDPRRFLAVAGAVAMVSVLLHLLNKDDDEYKELPDFVRNNYWWVRLPSAEHALYIPKPFEVGVLGSVAERMTELATAGDDYRAGDFASTLGALLMDQLSMNPVPQAFKPAMEAAFNYDSFRKTAIDSMGQERLPPAERYTSSTSAAAVAAGRLANISPQRLEHLMRGYFGWLGTQALNAGDYMLRGPMDLPANPRRDATNPDNWTLYGDFVKPVAGGSSKYLDRFYEMQHQVDQLYASASEARKVDDLGRLEELAGNSTLKLRPIYNAANRRITAINQRMRAVSNDPTLGAEEKMALLRELSESRNQVARRVDERARAAQ